MRNQYLLAILALLLLARMSHADAPPTVDVRCGSYSLFVALRAFELGPDRLDQLEEILGSPGLTGYSMLQLQTAARRFGAETIAVETSLANLRERAKPYLCLTLIDENHFVLLYDADDKQVAIIDPPSKYSLNRELFESRWSHQALLIAPSKLVAEEAIARARFLRRVGWSIALGVMGLGIVVWAGWGLSRRRHARFLAPLSLAFALLLTGSGCRPTETGSVAQIESPPPLGINPWLSTDPEKLDLGSITRRTGEQQIPFRFVLRNRGFKTIKIDPIETSCSCTSARLGTHALKPGETTQIQGTVRVGETSQSNSARLTIFSDDPVNPKRSVSVVWLVRNALRTDPPSVELPSLEPAQPSAMRELPLVLEGLTPCHSCEFRLIPSSKAVVGETDLTFARSATHRETTANAEPQALGKIKIRVVGQVEEQHYAESLVIQLSCRGEDLAQVRVPVSWTVASAIVASPTRLFVGQIRRDASVSSSIVLQSRDGVPFKIVSAELDPSDRVFNAPLPASGDSLQRLDIHLNAPGEPGPWRRLIVLKTDHPTCRVLQVPISGFVESGGSSDGR